MVADDRRSRLLGLVLPAGFFTHADTDAPCLEQLGNLGIVFQVGARGVAPRITPTAILLAEEPVQRRTVFVDEAPLAANAMVPELGERLGHLDTNAMHDEVLLVLVLGEQLGGCIADPGAHRDDVKCRVVDLAALNRAEEVGDAQERRLVLAWVRKPHAFAAA